jgi:hypothetical protein
MTLSEPEIGAFLTILAVPARPRGLAATFPSP